MGYPEKTRKELRKYPLKSRKYTHELPVNFYTIALSGQLLKSWRIREPVITTKFFMLCIVTHIQNAYVKANKLGNRILPLKAGQRQSKRMGSQHYSLRWNNHQNHILNAFDTLLQSETLVDVTLVCEETSVRAHKVVLSACSPYFQRIFSENPCKHPIIVLKDLRGWEVQAIVDFMYKGEISVVHDQLQNLIKAAESLQVRGLTQTEQFSTEKDTCGFQSNPFTPSPSLSMYRGPGRPFSAPIDKEPLPLSPYSPSSFETNPLKMASVPHMPHIPFTENSPIADQRHREGDGREKDRGSPIPRRKQARPMRRSGELQGVPQDLSKTAFSPINETAENLSLKKSFSSNNNMLIVIKIITRIVIIIVTTAPTTTITTTRVVITAANIEIILLFQRVLHTYRQAAHPKVESQNEVEGEPPERDPMDMQTIPEDFLIKADSITLHTTHPPDSTLDNPNFLPIPSLSALSMTPPHIFSLDQQLGLFPGIENCRNPLISDLPDHRSDNHLISKRKMGRPKGQHSAPRGGPPRSWTNAELTEALQHVWNKKMTTSQASRIFGIPYNSLLMYVRGKYGKSLKLEQLKKDCLGGPGGPLDLLSIGANPGNNNNHPGKPQAEDITSHGTRTTDQDMSLPPGFNPYAAANFFPDFGPPFPVPVSMIHLLPQSEKNRELFGQTDKARDLFHPTDKAREIFHQTEKARELFNQAMQLPQDLSSPDSKEDEFRAVRSKSRDNNNVTSLEGSPVTNLKSEPHPPMMENGSEN
ncbi:hypothetical protein RUM43_003749 [Polyplax serrata]|uniref:Protein jim lovell n=1 Tax=Polyplax serrata TaxID=468196 RepID=A0AAN8Q1P4_POLSC